MDGSQIKRRLRNYLPNLPGDIFKIAIMLIFIFPFYWMIITAFKTYSEAIQTPPTLWPQNFTLEAFTNIFSRGIAIQLVVMVPASYAFSKRRFPLQGILFGIVLIAFMIPGQITYISVYLMMSKAKLINSLWPQILPLGANAFGIFMLQQGFKQIPDEIIESARLDNASEAQIMTRICLPMCKSSMITIAMFSFIGTWNAYFWPLVMTNSDKFRPLTLYIEKLKQEVEQGIMWNEIMAGNFILVVPVIIVFIFASKKIIQAFAYNGMK